MWRYRTANWIVLSRIRRCGEEKKVISFQLPVKNRVVYVQQLLHAENKIRLREGRAARDASEWKNGEGGKFGEGGPGCGGNVRDLLRDGYGRAYAAVAARSTLRA